MVFPWARAEILHIQYSVRAIGACALLYTLDSLSGGGDIYWEK